jgi:phosphopantetheinyl transferase
MLWISVARIEDLAVADCAEVPPWMGSDERRRWADQSATGRREFVASRALLRRLLQASTGVPSEAWDISAVAGREPIVRGPTDVRASLSHRLGWVAAAVSDTLVGVDVECARPSRSDPQERAALTLAPEELPAWSALAPEVRESALLTRWTAKESWFKAAPSQDAAWDFRRVIARACAPARANVRTWVAAPLHVAVCSDQPRELAEVECEGLDPASCTSTFWHVALA